MGQELMVALIAGGSAIIGSLLTLFATARMERRADVRRILHQKEQIEKSVLIEAAALVQKTKDVIRYGVRFKDPQQAGSELSACINDLSSFYRREHAKIASLPVRQGLHAAKRFGQMLELRDSSPLDKRLLDDLLQKVSEVHLDILATIVQLDNRIWNR